MQPVPPPKKRLPRSIGAVATLGVLGSVIGYAIYQIISPGMAAILIESQPQSLVYINGEQIGKTPVEFEAEVGEVVIRMVPEDLSSPLVPYETKTKLTKGVKTIVRHIFGESSESSYGHILSFERFAGVGAGLTVVSDPDGVQVFIDGNFIGVTPLRAPIAVGEAKVSLRSPGLIENTFRIRAETGYLVTAIAKLALVGSRPIDETSSQEVLADELEVAEEIEIASTPLGFLRVRSEPDITSPELGRVETGARFMVLEKDDSAQWYRIEFEKNITGWVFGEYINVVESESI